MKDHNRGFKRGLDPQVIHNVDKKVTYQAFCLAKPAAKRRKNT
jgi:hypothetical protein